MVRLDPMPACLNEGVQLTLSRMHNDLFTVADGRDARLPASIGSKILLRRESTAGDIRIHRHRRKVTEPAFFVAPGNDASGGVDRARAGDLY